MKQLVLAALFLLPALASAQSVDLLYKGETYVPPFYPGGALWSGESTVTLFAVPQGLGDPATLNYKWRQGTTVLGSQSGVGRDSLTFADSIFSKPQVFSVQILDGKDEVLAQAYVSIAPSSPSLLIYEENPLYGFFFNREVGASFRLDESETTFAAFPLFFSAGSRKDGITYAWRSGAAVDSAASEATYRVPDGARGEARVSVAASNPSTLRQTAERSFLIQFGNEN